MIFFLVLRGVNNERLCRFTSKYDSKNTFMTLAQVSQYDSNIFISVCTEKIDCNFLLDISISSNTAKSNP